MGQSRTLCWLCCRVYGSSEESVLVAVVIPDKHAMESWASSNGVSGSYQEILKTSKVYLSGDGNRHFILPSR